MPVSLNPMEFSEKLKPDRAGTITIRHIVTNARIDGKYEIIRADRAENTFSLRALPLAPGIREKLLTLKERQKENRQICGNCCNKEYGGCVFADVMDSMPQSPSACRLHRFRRIALSQKCFRDSVSDLCSAVFLESFEAEIPDPRCVHLLNHPDGIPFPLVGMPRTALRHLVICLFKFFLLFGGDHGLHLLP